MDEVLDALKVTPGMIVIDATVNGGGHSEQIALRLAGRGKLLCIDQDASALAAARERLAAFGALVCFAESNFKNIRDVAAEVGIERADALLFDLGFSSNQLEHSGRGFSFQKDEPLLMTYRKDPDLGEVTARDVVNDWSEATLADIIYGFGEERQARKIARAIVTSRVEHPIETTSELVRVIEAAIPRRGKIHPATKTFQAIRIAVNDELSSLSTALQASLKLLAPHGTLAVISFHSLEDRIVKQAFKAAVQQGLGTASKKPITANSKERTTNPRARSAKLRVFQAS